MSTPRVFSGLHWPLAWLIAASVFLVGPMARGQGLGVDPYRPYNSQYDPFVYAIQPDYGDVVPNGAAVDRGGIFRANQYQSFLSELQGKGASNPGYSIGRPYFRSARQLSPADAEKFQYQPNKETDRAFFENQNLVSEKYFQFIRERDPRKRAELLRAYNQARAQMSRELGRERPRAAIARGRDEAEQAREREEEPARPAATERLTPRPGRDRSSTAPPLPTSRLRPGGPAGTSTTPLPNRTGRLPDEILNESLRRDREQPSLLTNPAPFPSTTTSPSSVRSPSVLRPTTPSPRARRSSAPPIPGSRRTEEP
jgi:hypothetical protein